MALNIFSEHLHPAIVSGATFPIYDSYWVGKLHLVLDDDIRWSRKQFVAQDAFVEPSETPGWRKWRIATPDDNQRTDGQIVSDGWDHEHCEICWQKIGTGGDREGYASDSNQWVCVGCYDRFIEPRDLRFVMAASRGHRTLISLLLDAGADVSAISEQHGYTALALAAQMGYVDVVEALLRAGASVRVPETFCAGSLLTYVKTGPGRENPRILELLTQAGAK